MSWTKKDILDDNGLIRWEEMKEMNSRERMMNKIKYTAEMGAKLINETNDAFIKNLPKIVCGIHQDEFHR